MAPVSATRTWQVVDQYVAAFEAARAEGPADLADFLPPADHPQFRAVLAELVRVELELEWERGGRPRLESYQTRFPELFGDPHILAEAAYEEFRLRRQAGETPSAADYAARFGVDVSSWEQDRPEATFPEAGAELGEFLLLGELGRGAFSRVYLARQRGLADRLVALKVSAELPGESQALAQLQHTYIVPIYSVHALGRWQALCMPYFGATTLADVSRVVRRRGSLPARGRALVDTVVSRHSETWPLASVPSPPETNAEPAAPPAPPASTESAALLAPLARLSYVEAVLWIVARAAEGLAHAHARGIVHQDLKPANLLLADDGRPMLLDFNLSADTKRRDETRDVLLGGTLPYMAPEQIAALIDGRSEAHASTDLFALGVILYELLSGRLPYTTPDRGSPDALSQALAARGRQPASLRAANPAVTPAVESIVRKCLAIAPADRYSSAEALREDLDRHLANLPLRHAPNPSTSERLKKAFRRHRWLTSTAALASSAVLTIALLAGLLAARRATIDSLEARAAAVDARADAQTIRFLLSQPRISEEERDEAHARAEALARRYGLFDPQGPGASPLLKRLPEAERRRVASDLADVVEYWKFDLNRGSDSAARQTAGRTVDALDAAGKALASLAGKSPHFSSELHEAPKGDSAKAIERLRAATLREPTDFAAWSLLGHSLLAGGRAEDAADCYTVCQALWPESPWPLLYRGRARYLARDFEAAAADFDRAIELRPRWPAALHERALARLALRQPAAALADIDAALAEQPASTLRLLCLRARAHSALKKPDGAKADLERALLSREADKAGLVARGLARLQLQNDAAGALADFDAALAIDPEYRAALEDKAHVLSERLDRPAEAISVLDRAIELYPDYVAARAGRGVLLARQGQRDLALADAKKALQIEQSPRNLYQVAGIYALASREQPDDRHEALRLLGQALRQGFGFDLLERDPDLAPLREDKGFQELVAAARAVRFQPEQGRSRAGRRE